MIRMAQIAKTMSDDNDDKEKEEEEELYKSLVSETPDEDPRDEDEED